MATKKFERERLGADGHSEGELGARGSGPPVAVAVAVKELNLRFEVLF